MNPPNDLIGQRLTATIIVREYLKDRGTPVSRVAPEGYKCVYIAGTREPFTTPYLTSWCWTMFQCAPTRAAVNDAYALLAALAEQGGA